MLRLKKITGVLLLTCSCLTIYAQKVNKKAIGKDYIVKGEIAGINDGKIYLSGLDDARLDSAAIKNGAFSFKGKIAGPMFYMLKLPAQNGGKTFFLEPGVITVNANKDSLFKTVVKGGVSQKEFEEWGVAWRAITAPAGQMYARLDSANQHGKVKESQEERKIFEDGMASLSLATYDSVQAFISRHPQSPVAAFIISDRYVSYPDPEKLASTFAMLGEKAKQSYYGKKITEYQVIAAKTAIGASPDFSLADTSGKMMKISSLRGKYVLVDFWASWCVPCRKENPNVVAAYKKYHDKGFDIVGVSLDSKKDAWMKAIEKDGLSWNHLSELNGWESGIVKELGVKVVPTSFLLDKEGKIIAKNLRGEALENKLSELLGR